MSLVSCLLRQVGGRGTSHLLIGIQQNNLDTVHYTLSVHRQLMDVLLLHTELLLQQVAGYLRMVNSLLGQQDTESCVSQSLRTMVSR